MGDFFQKFSAVYAKRVNYQVKDFYLQRSERMSSFILRFCRVEKNSVEEEENMTSETLCSSAPDGIMIVDRKV